SLKLRDDANEIRQRTPEAIKPPDNQRITLPQRLSTMRKLGTLSFLTACLFLINREAPRRPQCVTLEIQILIISRYPGISNQLSHTFNLHRLLDGYFYSRRRCKSIIYS